MYNEIYQVDRQKSSLGNQMRSSKFRRRKYELKKRAESQRETRRRIVQAAVELHEAVGPLVTNITAIAKRAGVERLTVRAHFPDRQSLFKACTEQFFAMHPAPDLTRWARNPNPRERLTEALTDLYRYYGEVEQMLTHITRDARLAPGLVGLGYAALEARMQEVLSVGWDMDTQPQPLVLAALGHALDFHTWHSLVQGHGLKNEQAVELMVNLAIHAWETTAGSLYGNRRGPSSA
jgi:AcrR family transcriptional regulator